MSETDHEAMVRWQNYAREHRSTVNSLFLTYAAALVGLQATTLMSKDTTQVGHSSLFLAAGSIALFSLITGCIVVLLRLRDARFSARIARYRVEGKTAAEIDALRGSTKFLGSCTNFFLPVQVAMFAVAALVFIYWVLIAFGSKLT
jgi:hypothetical protein